MQGELVQIEKYGMQVWANADMDGVRRSESLCFNCKSLNDCEIAASGLRFCKLTGIAYLVTRCPKFIKD